MQTDFSSVQLVSLRIVRLAWAEVEVADSSFVVISKVFANIVTVSHTDSTVVE